MHTDVETGDDSIVLAGELKPHVLARNRVGSILEIE
jgi:hypothetical protein